MSYSMIFVTSMSLAMVPGVLWLLQCCSCDLAWACTCLLLQRICCVVLVGRRIGKSNGTKVLWSCDEASRRQSVQLPQQQY